MKDSKALFNIGYGLYVVTVNDGKKDNGLIVNTVCQLTASPERVGVTVNKANWSHDVIKNTGKMNVNCLSTDAPFKVFEAFGFVSGRDVDKFKDCSPRRSENGLVVLPKYINAYISLEVEQYIDLDTHGMFICKVTDAEVISTLETMTYTYYHKHVKPKPQPAKKKGYICTICGYIHDEDELPDDFVCPICKHGKEDFEELK
ncbi:MAG: flavin reductase [Clostridia bacterium]|jgi:flavin reductase (DIM6/NTAB) family NADH-FMN oxidoreductase RutF|nr:flavin reductase [Clostridia bacterium]